MDAVEKLRKHLEDVHNAELESCRQLKRDVTGIVEYRTRNKEEGE